jgi:hypothetical protein
MAWQLKGSPKTVRVTNKLAKEWVEMGAAHVDRPLSERRMQVYEKIMAAGGFRPVAWAKAYCKETGQWYRVNGKHTSTLYSTADLKNLPDQYVVVEEYEADTVEDVARLYATFDSRSQTRTVGDINRSFAAAIPELAPMTDRLINLAVGALAFNIWPTTEGGFAGKAYKQPVERAELLFDHVPEVVWLNQILPNTASRNHLWRMPVAAAMIGTWGKSKAAATEFWTAVRDETGGNPDLPDRKLARWLLTIGADGTGKHTRTRVRYRPEAREFYVRSIHAWNAWRAGKTTELKYYTQADIPAIK